MSHVNEYAFSIFLLNKESLATSTLAPLFYCNRVIICCCKLVIRVRSCSSLVDGAYGTGAANCPIDCCYCWQDIYSGSGGNGNGNDDNDDFS